MIIRGIFSVATLFCVIAILAVSTGKYMAAVYQNRPSLFDFFKPAERLIFRLSGINPLNEMSWKHYLSAFLVINGFWFIWGFLILLFQGNLPLNPSGNPSMEWGLAFNSAISFLTSTNLQHYSGESGATYFSQIAVFMFLQFLSAGASLAAGIAVVRGLGAQTTNNLGNFYNDFVLSVTRILLPLSFIAAVIYLFSGMPMTLEGPDKMLSLQGDTITVARGPVAAFIPIKELGSNGGGFFGANDAHPFENPGAFTFIVHTITVLLLPAAFIFMIGYYLDRKKFSMMLFGIMTAGFLLLTIPIMWQEISGNPAISAMGINTGMGNMEGKEVRFGSVLSSFYSGLNIVIPAGTVTGMHDSFMPLSGAFMILGMQIDAFFGGVGTGWLNMLIFLVLAIFIGSMMIGRTPEIFGKKLSIKQIQIATGVYLIQPLICLGLAAIVCFIFLIYPGGNDSLKWFSNNGAHNFTTTVYEYISSFAGNGSGFEGLGDNTIFWNLSTSFTMLAGRFLPIAGTVAIAGMLQMQKYVPPSYGTLRTDSVTFGILLFFVILVLQALSMFSVLILGPIKEYFILTVM